MSDAPLIADVLPKLADEIEMLLKFNGNAALANQVPSLRILERCQCGLDFCATIYTEPRSMETPHASHDTDNIYPGIQYIGIIYDRDKIAEIELFYQDEIREKLDILFPPAKRTK